MNEYLSGFILGLVQGLTEFLPVSSSGHLMLLESLGVGKPDIAANLMLHLGTLAAVAAVYRKRIVYLIKHPLDPKVKMILVASIPTGIIAALVRYFLPQNADFLPFCFIVTSAILVLPKIIKPKESELENKLLVKSLAVGLAQGLACVNGISRSGSTVTALRLCGVNGEESAELSFMLSVPVIVASSVVEIVTSGEKGIMSGGVILGTVVSFIVGIAAIKSFIAVLKKDKTAWFSIYTTAVGIAAFFLLRQA